jgi:hypothetical protein
MSEPAAVRRALDLFVFAPVGVALTVLEDLPGLVAKGRRRVETDLRNARVIGEFVVNRGQKEVAHRMTKPMHGRPDGQGPTATTPASSTAPTTASTAPSTAAPQTSARRAAARRTPAAHAPAAVPEPPPAPATAAGKAEADPADGAIVEGALAGYDTLSASQVVRRLESLGPDELRAVHGHEASHRNRRTILNRAHQLLEAKAATGGVVPVHDGPAETDPAAGPDRPVVE